jgi:ABC-type uncharacterized transport system substrate-binding protein
VLLALLVLLWTQAGIASRSLLVVSDRGNHTHRIITDYLGEHLNGPAKESADIRIDYLDMRSAQEGIPAELAPDLILTVGTNAAARVNGQTKDVPVLNVFLPHAAFRQLSEASGHQAAAIVLDQPLKRQLAVAHALLPDAQRAGMLRGSLALHESGAPAADAVAFGLNLNIYRIEDDNPAAAIQQLLNTSDVVIAIFDPEVYKPATAKWLLYLAFQQQRPIVGFSYALLKAGAVAAVFSTPEQIAEHAEDVVAEWLRSGNLPSGTQFPRYYHIGLNGPVAKRLGIVTPSESDLQRRVQDLLGELP